MPKDNMTEYREAAQEAYDSGLLPLKLYRKLMRVPSIKHFYLCLEANGYMGDVWDAIEEKDKYPWKKE